MELSPIRFNVTGSLRRIRLELTMVLEAADRRVAGRFFWGKLSRPTGSFAFPEKTSVIELWRYVSRSRVEKRFVVGTN